MRMVLAAFFVLLLGASASAWQMREIHMDLTVPDPSWSLRIHEAYKVGDELWVIAVVSQNPDVMAAQVLTTVHASAEVPPPELPAKYFVLGKTWKWENPESYLFIDDTSTIKKQLRSGRRFYPPE